LILLAFIAFISAIAGIYPSAILSAFNPAVALKGNFSQSKGGNMIRKTLVVFQFTITIGLVASIFIITQQMDYIKNKSLGFNGSAVIQVSFNGDHNVVQQYASIKNELLKSPYILNVTAHNQNIVGGLGNGWTTTENLKGDEISTSLYGMSVDADYFKTYDMKLAAGRFFSKDIPTDTIKSVLVNEAAVRTFGWQKPENAIGKPFGKGDRRQYVIGVVKDFNFESLHKPVEALMIYYSLHPGSLSLKIDASHIDEAVNQLKKTWSGLAAAVPLQYSFVDVEIAKQYGNELKMEGIFYGFSALSLLIACLGLFGLSTFVVERKIKEIGIRKVLGANVSGIVGLLSKDFLKLVLISILIATPLAWYFMNNWLQDFAYRIQINWWVFLASGIIAVFIAFITVSIKAIKAAIANPVKSLRTE
jgi:putative ABC transport system permease protein